MWTSKRRNPWKAAATATALLFASCAATGEGDGFSAGSVLRSIDNDSLANSDDQYTSGVSLSYLPKHERSFADAPLPDAIGDRLDAHWPFADQDERFVIYSLSHRIFTPTDLEAREPVEDDLPYSAFLYGTATVGSQSRDELNAFSLSLGVVGPAALGEEVQRGLHDLIGSREPEGWSHQLENEPLLNLGFEHRRRLHRTGDPQGLGADLLGAVAGSAGNLQTQATLAGTLRMGYRVPSNFHMQSHFLAEESLGIRAYDRPEKPRSLYAFTGFAATAIANAIFLDGNTFSGSHSVDHDHYVLRGSVGVAGQYGPLLATISYERASLPWDHPEGLDEESFLRLGLSWDF